MYIDSKFQLPDGTLVGWEYFGDQGPIYDENGNSQYPQVTLVIPGERYRFVEAREALALAGGSLVALLLAARGRRAAAARLTGQNATGVVDRSAGRRRSRPRPCRVGAGW